MKKSTLLTFLLSFLMLFTTLQVNAYQMEGTVKTKRIPQGTKIELEIANEIKANSLSEGDMISAYLTRDVRTVSTMILPRGTVVRGSVKSIKQPRMPYRPGVLYLSFDHVVAPNGQHIPLKAGIYDDFNLDSTGGIVASGSYSKKVKQNWSKSGSIIKKSTKWGITSGEDLFKGGKYLVTPFSAVGGAIAGAGYFTGVSIADLFKKGNNVEIPKGKVFNIMLLEAIDVPISE